MEIIVEWRFPTITEAVDGVCFLQVLVGGVKINVFVEIGPEVFF